MKSRASAPTVKSAARVASLRESVATLDQLTNDVLWEDRAALTGLWP